MADSDVIQYLTSLKAVRERSKVVFEAAKVGSLSNFEYHADKLPAAADFVISVIERDFGPDKYQTIPPHGRWQHFNVGSVDRITPLLEKWEAAGCDKTELTRRLIDLFVISVLLDAGAGDVWTFKEPGSGNVYNRSEGIAVASLYMFLDGALSSDKSATVDAKGLLALTDDIFDKHFQITAENPMVGISSRVQLLNSVGKSIQSNASIFGDSARPGGMVDYLIAASGGSKTLDYEVLWSTLQKLLLPAWPSNRTQINGVPIGDAWPLAVLERALPAGPVGSHIQPFHKLTQWLGYSLTVPFVRVLGFSTKNTDLGTGLPEYRNGGLFVDMGVLTLKDDVKKTGFEASSTPGLPLYSATGDVIVEWRALTLGLLDELYVIVKKTFQAKGVELSMAQMLEAGTWKGGRELAAKFRPETKSSPILIDGDGTLF
ncbi:uncharacterized protein BROUX77_003973 [Berkeleyomyces rouxiae]|uniref:uncharacterized protein n=1 Tax=Berkeleyomyces rouxiae TaxID=2035830 RepID=UPI003B7B4D82